MCDTIRRAVVTAEWMRRRDGGIASPIDLRREMRPWFDSTCGDARHHIDPACRPPTAILRTFRKNRRRKKHPEVSKLSMKLDAELVKIAGKKIRVRTTIRPGRY